MPKVSVIIPTYNYARFLGEAIQSVLDQTFPDFELIIVDDGSTDNTAELVGSYREPRIKYIYQENGGAAAAQNTGLKAAGGEYITFLGADDMWLPENLSLKVKLLDSSPEAGLVCSDIYLFENSTGVTLGRLWHDMPSHYRLDPQKAAQNPLRDMIDWGLFIWPQGAMIRRMVFDEVGYFDESLITCEDWDLFIRIVQRFPVEAIDLPLARIRRHNVSLTANEDRMAVGEMATLKKLLGSGLLTPELRTLARRKLASISLPYGRRMIRSGRVKEGRKALIDVIKARPLALRPYIHLARSVLAGRGARTLTAWANRLRGHDGSEYREQLSPPPADNHVENRISMPAAKPGKSTTPRVTVVIPTRNYARFLGEAIQSVLDQTFTDFELIVVDDGSTDNTKAVVEGFKDPRIRYIYQEHRGVTAAENAGHKASRGEYITGLGADDIYLPQNLELKVRVLDAHPELALVCSDAYIFDGRTGAILGRRWHDKPFHYWVDPRRAARQPLKELLARGCFIAPQTALSRKQLEEDAGLFDEALVSHEDWDLYVRILKRFPIETLDIPLVKIRQHGDSMCADWDNIYLGAVKVLNKAMSSYSFSGEERKLVKTRLARTHFSYGKSMILNGKATLGREKFWVAIKTSPRYIKPYIFLAMSLLGDRAILSLKTWKKRFA